MLFRLWERDLNTLSNLKRSGVWTAIKNLYKMFGSVEPVGFCIFQ